ncbi:hypothetical protein HF086_003089 [Spodoptera exigua]|uniref:Uncharacterized protein n=1 Tax=Spodoptera exigua TaxID=7107 RepID=A0A922SSC0_SPOEX|nr:hypothetical protein HF086_003089 [Spodoptera exigua]
MRFVQHVTKLQTSGAQFPSHIDLQKVGDVIFNNEKYNVLKPTVHVVTDYFKDFMLRQEEKSPTKRIFIDHNGFRHAWSGFGNKVQSLRKTDLKNAILNKNFTSTEKPANKLNVTTEAVESKTTNETDVPKTKVFRSEDNSNKQDNETKKSDGQRTVAKTTFFCPFFGVITMSAFID